MDNSQRSSRSNISRRDARYTGGLSSGHVSYAEDFDHDEFMNCIPSPTQWICESLQYGFSPTNKIMLKGSRTTTVHSSSSGITSSDGADETDSCAPIAKNSTSRTSKAAAPRLSVLSQRSHKGDVIREDISEFGGESVSSSVHSTASNTRIIAPNVSKLSLGSVVEILLEGDHECVAVLCSVDVLKMKSHFFRSLLLKQELEISATSPPSANELWRRSLAMEQQSPFEAAAFLESLHEGRGVASGEWCLSWATLSVQWKVEELQNAYSDMISRHIHVLLSSASKIHWRTNIDALVGMRIALFRKNSSPMPSVTMGYVIQGSESTPYSHVRVAFEPSSTSSTRGQSPPQSRYPSTPAFDSHSYQKSPAAAAGVTVVCGNIAMDSPSAHQRWEHATRSRYSQKWEETPHTSSSTDSSLVGEVTVPFWVQEEEGAVWTDADDVSAAEINKVISENDKVILWEMILAVIQHPSLAGWSEQEPDCENSASRQYTSSTTAASSSTYSIRSVSDVVEVFKRVEFRVLWTESAPDTLPLEAAVELVRDAYLAMGDNDFLATRGV